MPFTIEDFHDLVRILEDKPEWQSELRRLVLSKELLALPEEMARLADAQRRTEEQIAELTRALHELTGEVKGIKASMEGMDGRFDDLKADIGVVKDDIKRLDASVGGLKGESLELRYRQRAASYLGRIVRRLHTLSTDELSALLDDAVDQGRLLVTEKDEVMLADLVVRGRRRGISGCGNLMGDRSLRCRASRPASCSVK